MLHQPPHEIALLISFGTSKGGSVGHLALAVRDEAPDNTHLYNFKPTKPNP